MSSTYKDSNGYEENDEPEKEQPFPQSTVSAELDCTIQAIQSGNIRVNKRKTTHLTSPQLKNITGQLMKLIACNLLSFSTLETSEFKNLLKMLNTQYRSPSRKFLLGNRLSETHKELSEIIKNELEKAAAVAISITSSILVSKENYLLLTAHYINEECQIKRVLLDCFQYENCTTEEIASEVKRILSDWEIEGDLVGLVADDAADMEAVAKLEKWPYLPCYQNLINLAIEAGLEEINVTYSKVKELSVLLKTNSQVACVSMDYNDIYNKQKAFELFNQFIQDKKSILSTLENQKLRTELTTTDWEILEHSYEILKMLHEITTALKDEKFVKISMIIYLHRVLLNFCKKYTEKDLPLEIRNMLKIMRKVFKKKIPEVEKNPLFAQATILDPRFKVSVFNNIQAQEQAVDNLKNALEDFNDKIKSFQNVWPENIYSAVKTAFSKRKYIFSSIQKKCLKSSIQDESIWVEYDQKISNSKKSDVEDELDDLRELNEYLEGEQICRKQNPLEWWLEHKNTYSFLFDRMVETLCIPATSITYERKLTLDELGKNESSETTAKQLLFLEANHEYLKIT